MYKLNEASGVTANMRKLYPGYTPQLYTEDPWNFDAAAAAKSLQSYPTLSDPMDCGQPGSSIHGIFQARVLEWGAIAFSGNFAERIFNPNSEINVDIPSEWEEKGQPSSKRQHEQRQRGIHRAILSHFWVIKDILSSVSGTSHMLEPVSFRCSFPPSFPFLDAFFGCSLATRMSSLIPGVCATAHCFHSSLNFLKPNFIILLWNSLLSISLVKL